MTWWKAAIIVMAAVLLGQHGAHPQASLSLAACIDELRRDLPSHREVKTQTFDIHTRSATDLRPTIENATRAQPEFELPIWDYLARRVDAQRVAQGLELLEREATALGAIAQRHEVDPATVVAVFGIETDYGRVSGAYPVVDATLSRACLNLKSDERKQHFFAALWLLQEGVVQRADFKGSWAGAFGKTQFLPGTFIRYMSDGPQTPAADIIHSVPDALATTARYLRGLGWKGGLPWGIEVKVPAQLVAWHAPETDHACLLEDQPTGKCRRVADWRAAGVTRVDGAALDRSGASAGLEQSTPTALLLPAGAQGPAWLITPNYQAIWRYNRADAYGLAIGLLSDSLRRGPPQRVPWPTDDPGLSRAQFVELQALLRANGHCGVSVDGAEGPRTQAAIREEELRLGLPVSGRAATRVLTALRLQNTAAASCGVPAAAASAAAPAATGPASTVAAGEPAAASAPASSAQP
jgi:glucose-6-phosphate 1-epimerase